MTGSSQVFAVRADGASVSGVDTLQAEGRGTVAQRELHFADGRIVYVDDVREMTTTYHVPVERAMRRLRDASTGCRMSVTGDAISQGELVGQPQRMYGHDVVSITMPSGSIVSFALDLSCAPLGHIMRFETNGESVLEPVAIRPGEPDASLFAIPQAYREVPPSVMERLAPDSSEARSRDALYERARRD